jgi:hypothetical protein
MRGSFVTCDDPKALAETMNPHQILVWGIGPSQGKGNVPERAASSPQVHKADHVGVHEVLVVQRLVLPPWTLPSCHMLGATLHMEAAEVWSMSVPLLGEGCRQ